MTTTTLFFNLYKRNLKGNISIMGLLTFVLYFSYIDPVIREYSIAVSKYNGWMNSENVSNMPDIVAQFSGLSNIHTFAMFTGLVIIMVATVIMGQVTIKYLHNKRSVDFYHELPIKRTTLQLVDLATVVSTIMIPVFIIYAGLICIHSYYSIAHSYIVLQTEYDLLPIDGIEVGAVIAELVVIATVCTFIMAVIQFACLYTGTVYETLIYACEIVFIPVLTYLIFNVITSSQFNGIDFNYDLTVIYNLLFLALPFLQVGAINIKDLYASTGNPYVYYGVWVMITAAFIFANQKLVDKRKSEYAEMSGRNTWLRNTMVIFAVFYGSHLFDMVFGSLFGVYSSYNFFYTIMWSIIILVIAVLILNRGPKQAVKKYWKLGVISISISIVAVVVVQFDLFGVENRVPAVESTKSVGVNTVNSVGEWGKSVVWAQSTKVVHRDSVDNIDAELELVDKIYTEKENIELVTKLHQAIIGLESGGENRTRNIYLNLDYSTGFGNVKRRYGSSQATVWDIYSQLINSREHIEMSYPLYAINPDTANVVKVWDMFGFQLNDLPAEVYGLDIYNAMVLDIDANGYDGFNNKDKIVGYVSFNANNLFCVDYEDYGYLLNEISLPVLESFTNTIKAMAAVGVTTDMLSDSTGISHYELGTGTRSYGSLYVPFSGYENMQTAATVDEYLTKNLEQVIEVAKEYNCLSYDLYDSSFTAVDLDGSDIVFDGGRVTYCNEVTFVKNGYKGIRIYLGEYK